VQRHNANDLHLRGFQLPDGNRPDLCGSNRMCKFGRSVRALRRKLNGLLLLPGAGVPERLGADLRGKDSLQCRTGPVQAVWREHFQELCMSG